MAGLPDLRLRRTPRAMLLAVALLLTLAALPIAGARAEGPTFALKPVPATKDGYFVFSGKPGQTLRGKVEVANVGSQPGKTQLYAVDATTGQTSGAVYRSRSEPKRTVGRWTSLGARALSLEPGQSRIVSFAVRVPAEVEPGQYLGGIVAQRFTKTVKGKGAASESGSFRVKVQALSVLAIQVNVPGPQRVAMTLSGITPGDQPGHQSLLLGIGNSGNVMLKGTGTVKVASRSGRQVQDQEFALDTFLPGTQIEYPVYIKGKALGPGRYRGTVSISYSGHELTRSFPFRISASDTEQVFGSTASQTASVSPSSSSSNDTLIYILIGVCALSLATAFYFWRHRRPA